MAMQLPQPYNFLSLPAIDNARQQTEWNALRNEGQAQQNEYQKTALTEEQRQAAQKRLYTMAAQTKQWMDANPQGASDVWATVNGDWSRAFQEMGLPAEKLPPAGASPDVVMEGINNILNSAKLGGGAPEQKPLGKSDLVPVQGEEGAVYSTAENALGQGVPQSSVSQAKDPASISEYKLYREQALAAGRQPMSFIAFRKEINKQQAAGRESGKLTEQLNLRPDVEAAVAGAVNQAKQNADVTAENRSNQRALQIYDVAVKSLAESMGDTWTGPVAGLMPAITSNQQIADGAVAAIAPVLKQLFRAAGEGIFTDKDQELLLAMVPTRTDRPDARASKLLNIDAIVRAKLMPLDTPEGGAADDFQSQWDAAPSGAVMQAPDGTMRRKP